MNVSERVVRQLRSGEQVSDEDANGVNHFPEIDTARSLIKEDDLPKLLELLTSERRAVMFMAITLLNRFVTHPKVSEALKEIWAAHLDYETRYTLLWRLLDDPHLPLEFHREILSFIKQDWSRFLKSAGAWYGTPANIMTGVEARLKAPSFPESKAWIYLCVALASPDSEAVKRLINGYTNSRNSFVADVARGLLQ